MIREKLRFIYNNEKIIILIALLAFILLTMQLLAGMRATPDGKIYLGTIHYAPDYFNYISWIVQGRDHILSSTLLYTPESLPYNLSRWEFVLTGFIFSKIGFSPIWTYHLDVFIFRITFFIAAYLVIYEIFPDSKIKRILSFLFFATSTAWPIITFLPNGLDFSYYNFWYNTGNFFSRFGPTPNHLLSSTLCAFTIFLLFYSFRNSGSENINKVKINIFIFISSFLLASINPIQYVLVFSAELITETFYMLWRFVKERKFNDRKIYIEYIKNSSPLLFLFAGGLVPSFYLASIYKTIPYSLVSAWEATQRLQMDAVSFFYSSGLVVVIALTGIIFAIRHFNKSLFFALVFIVICGVFFFSDLSTKIGIMNVRFWPQTVYIFISVFAAWGTWSGASLFKRKREFVLAGILFVYIGLTAASYTGELKERFKIESNNELVYIGYNVWDIYKWADKNMEKDALVLVIWPYNESFPAVVGRKVYYGDPISHMSIDGTRRSNEAGMFFGGNISDEKAKQMINNSKIDYVIGRSSVDKYSFLNKVYWEGDVGVYKTN